MNNKNIVSRVHDNAGENLPYQLREALKKSNHNLLSELIYPASIVLENELPSKVLDPSTCGNTYWIGYYHEKSYIDRTYEDMIGKVETKISEHVPERVVTSTTDNVIEELKK